jgi:membrane-associated protease RseP (regulator of RpoE activity)
MIIPALVIFILGRFIPIWVFKFNQTEQNSQLSWKYVLTKMSGSLASFLIAFIIICILTLACHERYLLNKNAIYGIKCSQIAKEAGFRDGDKIISINNQQVERFSDILKKIILEGGPVSVKVQRRENEDTIMISNKDKLDIMRSKSDDYFVPRTQPDSIINDKYEQLTYIEARSGLKSACNIYGLMFKQINILFSPRYREYENIGGFIIISPKDLKSISIMLAMCLILIGLINLLPLPGLDLGNTVIALFEKIRGNRFNKRLMAILKTVCIVALILIIIAIIRTK